jgi:predicted nuclease of predicted toxin-antitoxin system
VKLLVDEALQNAVALSLTQAGHDATHIRLLGLAWHTDDEVMALALREDRVLATTDTDSERSWP